MAFVNHIETNSHTRIDTMIGGLIVEENSDYNNFLFSSRRGECMLRKKIGECK